MSTPKVRKTITLDPDLVAEFEGDPAALSATVNAVLRAEKQRREDQAALATHVADLVEAYGEPDPETRATVAAVFDSVRADGSADNSGRMSA
ncbi:hypothetical protein ACIA03_24315 [Nocardioides sp. NPDC051685]|uniref:hypothetical protein n=1 Tax=Nocardioides sp. NPDC051685 TaxID=3364334 RepID=UPI0037972527